MSRVTEPCRGAGCWIGVAAAAVVLLVVSCSAPPPVAERDLYDQANAEFEASHFRTAANFYDELLEQFPFSDLAEVTRLRVAHAYYLNQDYEKAVATFNDFERLHPTSALLPFVEYTIGMSYMDQARSRDRDKSASENALQQFERVRDRYAGSLYGRLAEFRIGQCQEILAGHELYVGDYYARLGRYGAARARYRYVLEHYAESDAAVVAKERLASADERAADADEEEEEPTVGAQSAVSATSSP